MTPLMAGLLITTTSCSSELFASFVSFVNLTDGDAVSATGVVVLLLIVGAAATLVPSAAAAAAAAAAATRGCVPPPPKKPFHLACTWALFFSSSAFLLPLFFPSS
jgi:hypothetical protein